jgi:hypothetical protein
VSRIGLGAGVVILLASCGSASPATPGTNPAQPTLVLSASDFGRTVQLQVSQRLELDLPGWALSTRSMDVLRQVGGPKAIAGRTVFAANRSGSQRITAVLVPMVSCPIECNPPAPRYGEFVVIVDPAGQLFDGALSELDNGRTFLLKSGQRLIAAIPSAAVADSVPGVVLRDQVGNDASISEFSAQTPGQVQLLGPGAFSVTLLVRPSESPYDIVASEGDGGKTIAARVGQVLAVRLTNSPGFLSWRGGSASQVDRVVDLVSKSKDGTAFTYLVRSAGKALIQFDDDPICFNRPTCADLSRTLMVGLEVGP